MTSEWTGSFIAADEDFSGAPLLRKEFALDTGHGAVDHATLRLSALGVIEAFIDGVPLSDDLLTPGWTSYEWRVRYAEIDVTPLIAVTQLERRTLAASVGNGWYRGRLGWGAGAPPYGEELAALVELRIIFQDGHRQVVATDETWKSGPSSITANSLYDGQHIDARLRRSGWNRAGFDDTEWAGVHAVQFDMRKLTPYVGPAVRPQEALTPTAVWRSPSGKTLVDFGQNLVGWVRVAVSGSPGDVVTLRHAEVLENGELGTRPLRTAEATDRYTLSGGDDTFEPTFTFHGFRYVEVTGWPGDTIDPAALTAVVIHSDLRRIGTFECSNELLNRLHENVVWGMRGNFVDVPTDCPQRDERLGWTGDIAAFAPTAAFLYDVNSFFQDWLRDLALEQEHHGGIVPFVVPDILKYMGIPHFFKPFESTAVWSDAAVWVPWAAWQAYGDIAPLREAFPSMASHARRVRSLLSPSGVWDQGFQFGDWLDPDAPPDRADAAKADAGVVATASAYRTARIVSESAALIGRDSEAGEFRLQAENLRRAFHEVYVSNERILSDCTTVYALAIAFDLLYPDEREWAGRRLAELVEQSGHHISTGFAGTPFIMDALSSTGHLESAYLLLLQEECPSWLYPVTMGATTVWERWDSMLPDGTINPGEMTSFNHYALGAVADWMHRVVGGIAPLEPGYRRLRIAPRPGGGIDWAHTTLDTPHGSAKVQWISDRAGTTVTATIPEGATGVLSAPDGSEENVSSGVHIRHWPGVTRNETKNGAGWPVSASTTP